jgi:hypothetical protein
MRKLLLIALIAAAMIACSSQQKRAMNEMAGDCGDYRWNMQRELAIADGEAIAAAVYIEPDDAAVPLVLDHKLALALFPTSEVRFLVQPERRGKKVEEFAGIAKVRVAQEGTYRFSTVIPYWVEIVTLEGTRVKSNKFEMQSQCKKVFKSAAFPLKANTDYWLQMSASRAKETAIIVTKEP